MYKRSVVADATRATFPSKRRHHELRALREDVARLQTRLAQLRSRKESQGKATAEMAWEAVAKCQRQRRKDAEAKNAQLRVLLVKQRRIARRLQKMLAKRCWDEPVWWEKDEGEQSRSCEGKRSRLFDRGDKPASEKLPASSAASSGAAPPEWQQGASLLDAKPSTVVAGNETAMQKLVVALVLRSVYGAIWFHTTHQHVAQNESSNQELATGSEVPKRRAFHAKDDCLDDHRSAGMDSESIHRLATDDTAMAVESIDRCGLMLPCSFEFGVQASASASVQLAQPANGFTLETSFESTVGCLSPLALEARFGGVASPLVY